MSSELKELFIGYWTNVLVENQKRNKSHFDKFNKVIETMGGLDSSTTTLTQGSVSVKQKQWEKFSKVKAKQLGHGSKEAEQDIYDKMLTFEFAEYGEEYSNDMFAESRGGKFGSWLTLKFEFGGHNYLFHCTFYYGVIIDNKGNETVELAFASVTHKYQMKKDWKLLEEYWQKSGAMVKGYLSYNCDSRIKFNMSSESKEFSGKWTNVLVENQKRNKPHFDKFNKVIETMGGLDSSTTILTQGSVSVKPSKWEKFSKVKAKQLACGSKQAEQYIYDKLLTFEFAESGEEQYPMQTLKFDFGGHLYLFHCTFYYGVIEDNNGNEIIKLAFASVAQKYQMKKDWKLLEYWPKSQAMVQGYLSYNCGSRIKDCFLLGFDGVTQN